MVKGLEGKPYKERLRSLGLFSLEETEGKPHCSYNFLMKGRRGAGTDLFSVVTSDRTQRNGLKLCQGRLSACIGSQDPYCGWDMVMKKCTTLEESLSMSQWEQSITVCPMRNLTVDGHFGTWSQWKPCTHTDGASVGSCVCRTRVCDSPAPQCGGWLCEGPTMEIANCSRIIESFRLEKTLKIESNH
ncbi:hypothetical protein BTVI_136919 [Pitangus sulphuratus]|nr:hypothetical protein BTVI_136919 [Pitangus sulphuratus]